MSQSIQIICDQCGARKGKTNHWYRVLTGRQGFHAYKSEAELADDDSIQDYCSDNCITRAFSCFLSPIEENKEVLLEKEYLTNEEVEYFTRKMPLPEEDIPF